MRKTTASINVNTSLSQVWNTVRKIRGRPPKTVHILRENGRTYSTTIDICNKLADTFSNTASDENYCDLFMNIKLTDEKNKINFESQNIANYNRQFDLQELEYVMRRLKDSAPSPDGTKNSLQKNLPERPIKYFSKLINRCYCESYFSEAWKKSYICPIPKPNKNPSLPINYRPISLTSVLCKVVESLINNRLLDYIERILNLFHIQCGGLKGRSTTDHLVQMETIVRKAFVNSEHLIAIFIDLEKAYMTSLGGMVLCKICAGWIFEAGCQCLFRNFYGKRNFRFG